MPEELDFYLTELLKQDMTLLFPHETFSVVVIFCFLQGLGQNTDVFFFFCLTFKSKPFRAALETCCFGNEEWLIFV